MLKQKWRSMNVQRKGPLHCGVYAVNIAPLFSINNLCFCFKSLILSNKIVYIFVCHFLTKGITASLLIQVNVEYSFSYSRRSSKKTV